jgi:hypothetical protein
MYGGFVPSFSEWGMTQEKPRDSTKSSKGKSILKLAHDLVGKMWDYLRREGARQYDSPIIS